MPQRTRMIRVWMSLVGSMTAGALLLSWLEGSPATGAAASVALSPQVYADKEVTSIDVGLNNWAGIKLLGVPPRANSMSLVALRPLEDVHFVVSVAGVVNATAAWRSQEHVDSDACVRIGVESETHSGTLTQAQLDGLRALVSAINEVAARPGQSAPLDFWIEDSSQQQDFAKALARQLTNIVDKQSV